MSSFKKSKKNRGDAPSFNSLPTLTSMYPESSDMLGKVETLSESDFGSSGSDNERKLVNDHNSWGFQDSDGSESNSIKSPPKHVIKVSKKSKSRKRELNGDEVSHKKKKKIKEDEPPVLINNSKAANMMKLMGYKQGEGLGKHGQGRVAPVTVSKQKGRRGLGLIIADVDRSLIRYNPEEEICSVHEDISWLYGETEISITAEELKRMIKYGRKKKILNDETHFCDSEILKHVLICKSAFDKMTGEEMRRARSRSNPYELIKKGPFLNRAAMKMANMDNVFDYMFTQPLDEYQNPLVGENELLYFADVCAGPGGFSEYVLWKKKWRAKGFGFTLKGDNDFKLEDFYAGPCESFEPFYGEDGDGNVYKPANIRSFTNHVMKNTDDEGVHFMMADGGFSVEGQENIQEILSKRIYLCQFLVALSIVRRNGHFICKLFDVFTPFSVGLIYLMYNCFKKISIHKPNTSRPANSERYIICKWRNENVDNIRDYLFSVNEIFNSCGESNDNDIVEVVPVPMMKNDLNFSDYIINSNNTIGKRQINSLAKILEYSDNETLVEDKQNQLKKECMDMWQIPIKARREPSREQPDVIFRKIVVNETDVLSKNPKSVSDLSNQLYTIYDWHAVVLGTSKEATFYLGASHKRIYKYEQSTGRWSQLVGIGLELSPDTLVYGEIVPELIGKQRSQRRINVFHIIDGHTLGGTNISHLHYTERSAQCALYAKSLTRTSLYTVMPIRMKTVYDLENIEEEAFLKMKDIHMKNGRIRLTVSAYDPHNDDQFYIPKGLMFIKATRPPYRRFLSKSNNLKYYWAPKERSMFDQDRPQNAVANFREGYSVALTWFSDEEEEKFNRQTFIKELVYFIRNSRFLKRDEK